MEAKVGYAGVYIVSQSAVLFSLFLVLWKIVQDEMKVPVYHTLFL